MVLQAHISNAHAPNPHNYAKPEKLDRPTVAKGCTSEDWTYFTSLWASYKAATKLPTTDINVQLLACCDTDLRKDLHRTDKELEQKDEDAILLTIASLAVRRENVMVSRLALHGMTQDREEGVRNFAARLRGQANECKFVVRCPCANPRDVDFTDQMIRDVLIRGLNDHDIQHEILGHEDQDMTLQAALKLIEAKEAGRRSQASLTLEGAHAMSQHKKANNYQPATADRQAKCAKCNKQFNRPLSRDGRIRPYKLCKHCFTSQRVDKKLEQGEKSPEQSGNVYDMMCAAAVGNFPGRRPAKLVHHVFSDAMGWQQRRSQPQPKITVTARVCAHDYIHFGTKLSSNPRESVITAIADTVCQSCLIGLKLILRLGLKRIDLLPVQHEMNAVNSNAIKIIGAALLRLSGRDKSGYPMETAQVFYVTPDTINMYLSREACEDLGLVSPSFPTVGEAKGGNIHHSDAAATASHSDVALEVDDDAEKCTCPPRSMPPTLPTVPPFPATEDNVAKLHKWLLDYYASSTFNTCPHTRLPFMAGHPLAFRVDPEAKPVAIHTPIPVPLHWQEEVKAHLDRDVCLGVIEPVPVGEPVTWCHRMVICKKKNGKPRRTVDLQALNAHCSRETHNISRHFTKQGRCQATRRKQCLMPEMAITLCPLGSATDT